MSWRSWLYHYAFWLAVVSVLCFVLERLFPWRTQQRAFRRGFAQDVFWLVFNGHFLAVLLGMALIGLVRGVPVLGAALSRFESAALVSSWPLPAQFVVLLVLKDFLEWCVHNLLHRLPWLWEFHKLHHSIEELDWIGNFRFHWGEVVVYRTLTYLPLALLGAHPLVWLWVAAGGTLIGHLNHANLNLSWGPLRYVLNSPRMHVWHHDVILRGQHGKNFGVVLSVWDWLFGTAEMPEGQPARLGFDGLERFPQGLLGRFFYPLSRVVAR